AINAIPGLKCLGPEVIGDRSSSYDLDPTKLCITVTGLGITGAEVEILLREEYGIEVELSVLYNVLCLITPGDTEESVDRLVTALAKIAAGCFQQRPQRGAVVRGPEMPPLALLPRAASQPRSQQVPLVATEPRVMAEFLMVYPPGIPLLLPGERITAAVLEYIGEHMAAGLPVQGLEDPTLREVRVVSE